MKRMIINYVDILIFNIMIFLLIGLCYSKMMLPESIANRNDSFLMISILLIVGMSVISSTFSVDGRYKYIRLLSLYLINVFLVETIYVTYSYKYSIYECFTGFQRWATVWCSGAILTVLLYDISRIRKYCDIILALTFIAYIIQFVISYVYISTGNLMFRDYALTGMAEGNVRNNLFGLATQRMNPPGTVLVFFPLSFWLFLKSENVRKKMKYAIYITTAIMHSFNIQIARSVDLYLIMTIVIMTLFWRKSSFRQVILVIFITVAGIIIINTDMFNTFISGFLRGGRYEGSTTVRLLEANNFINRWMNGNILLGIGAVRREDLMWRAGSLINFYDDADIGMLSTICRLGILGIILELIIFVRWISIAIKAYKSNSDYSSLAIGLLAFSLMFNINIDMFFSYFRISVPFIIAIMEYINIECDREYDLNLEF